MFIVSVVQLIKIGDLSLQQSGVALSDPGAAAVMDVDDDGARLPDGPLTAGAVLDRASERALVREATAGFADWAVALFRRVFALFENLPEEGGRKQTTGGKQEETVLKSVKSMLDVVCLHLSRPLFALVLRLVHDYASSNAKANAVRAFGQLVACLARVDPGATLARFMPSCVARIEEELAHGASSTRTTSSHAAAPSDTTLHWSACTHPHPARTANGLSGRHLDPARVPRLRRAGAAQAPRGDCAPARPARRAHAQRARLQRHRPPAHAPHAHTLGRVPAPRAVRE
jgi:proteasome activator subunit 4